LWGRCCSTTGAVTVVGIGVSVGGVDGSGIGVGSGTEGIATAGPEGEGEIGTEDEGVDTDWLGSGLVMVGGKELDPGLALDRFLCTRCGIGLLVGSGRTSVLSEGGVVAAAS